jgi:hypothetical protein
MILSNCSGDGRPVPAQDGLEDRLTSPGEKLLDELPVRLVSQCFCDHPPRQATEEVANVCRCHACLSPLCGTRAPGAVLGNSILYLSQSFQQIERPAPLRVSADLPPLSVLPYARPRPSEGERKHRLLEAAAMLVEMRKIDTIKPYPHNPSS